MRVLLADDHTLVRAGLRRLLEGFLDIEVVAEAKDGREAVDMVALYRPDVALIDLTMPVMDGLGVTKEVVMHYPDTVVVMMSMHADTAYVRQALTIGALGFVVKEAAPAELELALRAANNRQTFLSPKVSGRMMHALTNRAKPQFGSRDAELSPRQREILMRLGSGLSTKEIAADLQISIKTVETHRARMMEALGLHRANELIRYAVENRISLGL